MIVSDPSIPPTIPRKSLIAIALSPLGTLVFVGPSAWQSFETYMDGPVREVLSVLVGGLFVAYVVAAPTWVVVWLLLTKMKARPRAWLVIPLFAVISAGLVAAFRLSFGDGAAAGVIIGLPTAITYCLIAGVPWRFSKPEAGRAPEGAQGP